MKRREEKVSKESFRCRNEHIYPLVLRGKWNGNGSCLSTVSQKIAEKLAERDQERCAVIIAWLRTSISFVILRCVHVHVTGTRSPSHRKQCEVVDDFSLNVETAGIF